MTRSTSSLIRRRSLLATPGVATRNSPVEGKRRTWNSWRTPQLDSQEEAKWQHQEKAKPLTRTAALELTEEGRESPVPRARTPADMEYSHLGTLELGSLRIANGEPSPAASARTNRDASQARREDDDYFPPEIPDSPIMMKTTRRRRHMRSMSDLAPPTPRLYRNLRMSSEARRAKTTSRYSTPTKPHTPNRPQNWEVPQHVAYEEHELELEPEPVRRLRVMNKSQDTLATMRSLQPAVSNEPPVPLHYDLAEDHDEGFVSDEVLSFQEEANRILDTSIFCEPAMAERSSSEESMVQSASALRRDQDEERRPPPKKADSGYSSGGSFRTKSRDTNTVSTTPVASNSQPIMTELAQNNEEESKKGDVASLYTFEQMLRASAQASAPPLVGEEHVVSRRLHRYRSHEEVKSTFVLDKSLPEDWNIDDLTSTVKIKASQPPPTPTSFVSQFSIDSKTSIRGRLQRRRSSFQEIPVVQSCNPIPEGSIPTIPTEIRKNFVRRVSEAPAMECLTQTYPTKDHVNSEDNEPDLPALDPIKFPSPPATPEPGLRGRHHKRETTERPSSPRRGLRRSLSLFRRKSKAGKEEKQPQPPNENVIFDLGTTAASLGRSPYDAALDAAHQKRVKAPTHPHQVSETVARVKHTGSMDSKTAADLARFRSKDRALLRPGMPARPKSYYSERETGPGADMARRHSFYGHAPPMPTIPSIGNLGAAHRSGAQQPTSSEPPAIPNQPASRVRAQSTGRGRVVTPLIEKYNQYSSPRPNTIEGPATSKEQTQKSKTDSKRSFSKGRYYARRHIDHPDWG